MISEWIGSDRVGSLIEGRFHLERWLGGADESGVFLTQIGGASPRKAAIKIIPAGIADAESLLDQWIKTKRRIHPHLIQLFHAGYCRMDDCDLLYAVTERADEILADVLPVRPLMPAEVRELLDPLLETLAWLHNQGLVHGSLKPSNVMVVNEQIRLSVDRIQPSGARTFPILSPGIYEAPESALKITPAADLWSLGVLLVEALTQKPPLWYGTGPRIPQSVPQPFASIASECLRLDPTRRCTLREIRSHLAPAVRALAMPVAVPRDPVADSLSISDVVAQPAPVSQAPVPVEAPPVSPNQSAASGSPALPANQSPDSLPISRLVLPPQFAERLAALLEPAPRALTPATPQPANSAAEATNAVEGVNAVAAPAQAERTASLEKPATVTEVAGKPIPIPVPAVAETAKINTAVPVADVLPADASAESTAPIASVAPDPQASGHAAGERVQAASSLRRTSTSAAVPAEIAPKPRPNRLATVVASAMVVIVAGLMLLIALHVSKSSSTAPPSSVTGQPAPAAPLPKAVAPPVSVTPSPAASSSPTSGTALRGVPPGKITPGSVLQRVLPTVTQHAMDTIGGRLVVIVRVQVDANGNVSDASYIYEGSSHYLKTAALEAAQNWKFRPAQIGGRAVPSTWDLRFWFDQSGPSVVPVEKAP